jgi:hypothetical protein
VTVAELAGVLAEDLTGRATDVAQWAQRLVDEEAPLERLVGAIQWSQFWTRHGGDEILVEHDRKIASRKNENPSMAKPSPKTLPNVAVKFGHSTPISKLNTVPVIAPSANMAIITRLHRRAIVRHSGSPVRCPYHSMSSTITGKAMSKHTSGM